MAEHPGAKNFEPQGSVGHEVVPEAGPSLDMPESQSAYLKFIDNARKAVAIAMGVFGAGFVICANLDPGDGTDFGPRTRSFGTGFAIGVYACLIVVLAFIVEHLARPAKPTPFTLRSLFVRSLFILITVVAIYYAMTIAYGPWQAIGAVVGTILLLAAVRENYITRIISAFLAVIVLGLTLLGTQSAYQYARWHADEIVAAGCKLMDQCPKTDYHTYNHHPEIDASNILALFGQEIQPSDPRVPNVLRKMGAHRIWVDEERVAVYVGSNQFDFSQFPYTGIEFQIYRLPHPDTTSNLVWGFRGKGATKITDRLWTNDY
jgi:hypothetical protein